MQLAQTLINMNYARIKYPELREKTFLLLDLTGRVIEQGAISDATWDYLPKCRLAAI